MGTRQSLLLDYLVKQQQRITEALNAEKYYEHDNVLETFCQYLPDNETKTEVKVPRNVSELISQTLSMNQSVLQPIDYLSAKKEIKSVSESFSRLKELIETILKEISNSGQTVLDI